MNTIMSDYLTAVCKFCGHSVLMTIEHGGRRAKCPKCEGIIDIPKGETSVRIRSDRELTKEARAKAGKTGPETDHAAPPIQGAKQATARLRRTSLPPKRAASNTALIVTIVASAVIVAGIIILLARR